MFGMEMMIKSLGLDPQEIKTAIATVIKDIQDAKAEMTALRALAEENNAMLKTLLERTNPNG